MHTAVAARNLGLDAEFDQANSGYLEIRTGSAPATPETSVTGTLLSTHTMNSTAFAAASSGSKVANAIANATAAATGTAGYARLYKTDHTTVIADLTVGTSASDINFDSVAFASGATIKVTGLTISRAQ